MLRRAKCLENERGNTRTRKPYTPANIFSLHRKRCELLLAICDNKSHPSMVSKR